MFDQITARELADELDAGEEPTIIDTRPEDSFESWHVPGAENVPFGPAETLDEEQEETVEEVANGDRIVAICGKGATSTTFAAELDANGYDDIEVVKGGMREWNDLYEQTRIETVGPAEILQFQRRGKGCLSYLIWDPDAGEGAVVDPTRHTAQYIVAAAEHDVDIVRVLDTHIHADHISAGRELADQLDIPYHLSARAEDRDLAAEFDPVEEGDVLAVGDVDLAVLAAPGHTSEMMNYRVGKAAVLTGDALFVDSVGRTELEFGEKDAERGAELEYDTLHDTLLELPDDVTVLPGHVTVTSDGRFANGSPGDPVAADLETVAHQVDLLGLGREAFVEELGEDVPEKPDNYDTIIEINTGHEQPATRSEATALETGANNCSA